MKHFLLICCFLISSLSLRSQCLSLDSIFSIVDSKFSPTEAEKLKKQYNDGDDQTKAVILTFLSMPLSSKKELTENYEKKQREIIELKKTFDEILPKGYVVFVELKYSEYYPTLVQSLDFQIHKQKPSGELEFVDGDWDLNYGSTELDSLLKIIDWDRMTLLAFKNILQTANCVSIQNGELTEIGFARSGLGKYFYILFPRPLTKEQIEKYNDGCEYIYYKDNVVLKYVGGMAGPQCFTD